MVLDRLCTGKACRIDSKNDIPRSTFLSLYYSIITEGSPPVRLRHLKTHSLLSLLSLLLLTLTTSLISSHSVSAQKNAQAKEAEEIMTVRYGYERQTASTSTDKRYFFVLIPTALRIPCLDLCGFYESTTIPL